jgi:phage terminase small subunit
MAVLTNSKHEQFAQAVAKGVSATKAYVSAGYSDKGAKQSAARMRTTGYPLDSPGPNL